MNRRIPAFAVALACASSAWAADPSPLTTLQAVSALSNDQASHHFPVSFEATVTYYRNYDRNLFVQDADAAIYVHAPKTLTLVPGDRVLVRGTIHESFHPYVESQDIVRVGHGALPKPARVTFAQMIAGEADCRLVTVHAVIRSANIVPNSQSLIPAMYLQMLVDGGPADADIDSTDEAALKDLLDSEVEITGVASGHFDNKMQQTGVLIHVPSLDWVHLLKRADSDPWALPATPMDRIVAGYRSVDLASRMRVQGTITYYEPGVALVLQNGSKSLWISTVSWSPLRVGDVADAIGFPEVQNGFLILSRSEIRDSLTQAPVTPTLFTWRELALGGNAGQGHIFDLVSVEGRVVTDVRQATEDEYVLESGGRLFSAILRHPGSVHPVPLPSMREIPVGTRIRVTGICMQADANPFNGEVPFNILMRSIDDIVVVAQPPWLNVQHLMIVVGILLAIVLALGLRGWYVEHRNRRRISSLAYMEQRRGKILEDINCSRPLAAILERITELASQRLEGAACWCRVADGAVLGHRPEQSSASMRIVEHRIASRSGPALGTMCAAFPASIKPRVAEQEVLAMAAALATLAIETSHLYSDLVHRSEFDLLTDIHNRFSLGKHLDALIEAARQSAGVFGLIYIDLDDFKKVNDEFGHQAGDLYLQEAARRMKRQVRPADTLARLGGDEFAVLVPHVRSRAEVEEIASRLENCLNEAFVLEGIVAHGSASLGLALYPENGSTGDSLLSAADAAMYEAKHSKHDGRQSLAESFESHEVAK